MEGKIIAGRVLVEPIVEKTTKSGLIIPDEAKKDFMEIKARVLLVGKEFNNFPMECKVGDIVWFRPTGGEPIVVEGRGYLLLSIGDITFIKDGSKENI